MKILCQHKQLVFVTVEGNREKFAYDFHAGIRVRKKTSGFINGFN